LNNLARRAAIAGGAYFAAVFLIGFALGTVRVLAVAPQIGETAAVLVEAPVMLAASWAVCGWLVRRFAVPRGGPRALMGALAFALLMGAELGVSVLLFGRSLEEHLANYRTLPGAIGLAAQLAFALIPLLRG
jgi:hypothetical protein